MNDETQNEENIEIETTSVNLKQQNRKSTSEQENKKLLKACDEDPYIVKLFKSLMKPPENQESREEKKK